ncbi:MAG: hypothetical protein JWM10_1423 [Myxococcaceae bacterium]|nr:hypothetical protein [Myxococcaceae bacterium]
MLPKVALWIDALVFLALGVWLVVDPVAGLHGVDVTVRSPAGVTELRAMYGGLELGLGAFAACAALRPAWRVPALWAFTLAVGALGATRGLSSLLTDGHSPMLWKFVGVELVGTLLNVAALRAASK